MLNPKKVYIVFLVGLSDLGPPWAWVTYSSPLDPNLLINTNGIELTNHSNLENLK